MKYFYQACTLMGMLFCNAYAKADTYEDHVFDSKQGLKEFMEINRIPHRSGFPNWREGQALTFEFEPGTQMQYSGEG